MQRNRSRVPTSLEDNNAHDANLFRSEEMVRLRMYVGNDAAHDVVQALGEAGVVEFVDLNPDCSGFQRTHAGDIKRCDEMLRKLRYFREQIGGLHVAIPTNRLVARISLNDLELQLADHEAEAIRAASDFEQLSHSLLQLQEELSVLRICASIYAFAPTKLETDVESASNPLLFESTHGLSGRVKHLSGCLLTEKLEYFECVVFRVTRGNSFLRSVTLPNLVMDAKSGKFVQKSVFMVFFMGSAIERKIHKVAEGFHASIFQFPETDDARLDRTRQLEEHIEELRAVHNQTRESRLRLLTSIAATIESEEKLIRRERAIFHTLNKFETRTQGRGVHAEGWCPTRSLGVVYSAIDTACTLAHVPPPVVDELEITASQTPPTFFQTNKFTVGFQAIVDAYGIANYQEFNPTPFTVITFPFLFAVMFGDLGHGVLMLLFALGLLSFERYLLANPPGEILGIFFGGRYVILLMSIFSIYTGLLYNDTFALSMNLFDSPYQLQCDQSQICHFANYALRKDPVRCGGADVACVPVYNQSSPVYPFGVDPIWKQSDNELSFTNSMKMKMAIVLGVVQMELGVLLSGLNHIHFRNWISLIHEFVPQFLFLTSIFGYMVIVIFLKWSTHYENTYCAPSILTLFIDFLLSFGAVSSTDGCGDGQMFANQVGLHKFLLNVAVLSVPWMLLAKPLILRNKFTRSRTAYQRAPEMVNLAADDGADLEHGMETHKAEPVEHFDFPEVMVHQVIHTIEFVLGAVSNTASYLRLWALSLAHAQLSAVFWERVVVVALVSGNPLMIVAAFMVWLCCTMSVLMVMESLSAFLHALRLHWVEFQNKFYQGNGHKFEPFLLKT